jgi:hypothetical protein
VKHAASFFSASTVFQAQSFKHSLSSTVFQAQSCTLGPMDIRIHPCPSCLPIPRPRPPLSICVHPRPSASIRGCGSPNRRLNQEKRLKNSISASIKTLDAKDNPRRPFRNEAPLSPQAETIATSRDYRHKPRLSPQGETFPMRRDFRHGRPLRRWTPQPYALRPTLYAPTLRSRPGRTQPEKIDGLLSIRR